MHFAQPVEHRPKTKESQAKHSAEMLWDTGSVGFVLCALASEWQVCSQPCPRWGLSNQWGKKKTPLEIILRAEEMRNLLNAGLFETAAAAGAYSPGWSQAIGTLHFEAVSTSFAVTSPQLSIWHTPVSCSWLLAAEMPEYRRSLSFSRFREDDKLISPLASQSEHPLIHFRQNDLD